MNQRFNNELKQDNVVDRQTLDAQDNVVNSFVKLCKAVLKKLILVTLAEVSYKSSN